jgi:thiosulfate/3-mercaptopyruvate sulfurtransferase
VIKPIVSASWLVAAVSSDETRVVDTRWYLTDPDRGRREYEIDHIPGATFLDLEADLSGSRGRGRHPLPDPRTIAETLGIHGIGNDHHVIVYDQGPGTVAARLWWLLRHIGHHRVSVLDGGLAAWRAGGYRTTQTLPDRQAVTFQHGAAANETIDRDALLARLGSVQVIDARAPERYRGETEPVDPIPGHIPTALSAPTSGNLDAEGKFKTAEELAHHFAKLGVDESEQAVCCCGSGVTACHNILALHVAGFPEAILYPGSWSDWCSSSFPIATGPSPGKPPRS